MLALSFGYVDDLGRAVYATDLDNYSDAFNPTYLPVLLRSVLYALATTVLCLAIGYPVAYYIARYGGRYRNVLIALLVLPVLRQLPRPHVCLGRRCSPTRAWSTTRSSTSACINDPIRMINTPWAVIGGLTYGYLIFMILPVYGSLERLDRSVIEAGKDLYGTPLQTFLHVTLPQTKQGILAGAVLVFLPSVGDFVSAQLLGGPDTYMVGNLIQDQFFAANNWPFGAALTVVMMLFLSVWMIGYLRSAARDVTRRGDLVEPHRRSTSRGSCASSSVLVYLFLFAPILVVILFSFNSIKSLTNFEGFSLQWYQEFLDDPTLRESLFTSLEIAFLTMVVGDRDRHRARDRPGPLAGRWAPGANILMLVPLVVPEIVTGISALLIFSQIGIALSFWTIVIAHITFSISYVTIVVRARMASISQEVEEAAMDLGATRWQSVRLVLVPALWPSVVAAGLLGLRLLLRRLRALVLHHRRGPAAAAGADLVGDPVRPLADDQRDRDPDDGRLADRDRARRAPAAAVRAPRERGSRC